MKKLIYLLLFIAFNASASGDYKHLIYQEIENIQAALQFIDPPKEEIDILNSLVRGELANKQLIMFANKIIAARETRNAKAYANLIHYDSFDNSKKSLDSHLAGITDGSLFYGNEDFKYFVTKSPVSDRYVDKYFKNNTTKPSFILYFYHYHPSNGMLIGSPLYLAETEAGYKIILPVRQ